MATQYTSLLGLALPVTGELSGSWGDVVNDSITSLLDSAISGTTSLTTDADVTLTTTTGAANQARQAIILWNPALGTVTRNITVPAQSKIYTVINASGGTQSIVLRGAGPTTGVTIIKGESAVVAWNGSDFVKISNTGGGGSFTNVTISGTTTLSGLTASTALALNASKEVVSVTNTGTGNNVLSASPTLTGTISGANASLSGTLGVTGVATFTAQPILSSLTASQAVFTDASKGLVSNAITGTGNVVMSASPTLTGTLTAAAANFSGAVALGDAAADNITVNGTVTSNLLFTDNTYDIGALGATRPRDLFLSRNLTVGGTLTLAGGVNLNGNVTVGDSSADTLTINSTITSNLIFTDNTYDIGASGATRPRNLFLAGNATIGGTQTLTGALTYGGVMLNSAVTGTGNMVLSNSPTLVTPALGTPASGVVTNLTGTASININGTVGATTANTGAFTTLTASGNVTLGDASTDTVTVNGYMGVGGAATIVDNAIHVKNTQLAGAAQTGVVSEITATSASTAAVQGFRSNVATAASAFTVADVSGFRMLNSTKGAGSTITNQHGVNIADLTSGTNNFGVTSLVSSGTNKWNIYASGTAANYFAGNVLLQTTTVAATTPGRLTLDTGANAGIDIFRSSSTANFSAIRFRDTTNANTYASIGWDATALRLNGDGGNVLLLTGGTERMRIDGSGNVGIGTSSPLALMHASAPLSAGTIVNVGMFSQTSGSNPTVGQGARITLAANSSTTRCAAIEGVHESGTNAHYLAFLTSANGTNPAERMRIDSAGNVGIGTSSPGARLELTTDTNNRGIRIYRALATAGGGYEGVLFALNNTSGTQIDYAAISANSTTATAGAEAGAISFKTRGSGALTERARIDSSGNLAIGTTTATERLTVSGNAAISGTITEAGSPVVTQSDIGTAPNEIPLNQYLGEMAYMNAEAVVIQPQASVTPNGIGDMVFQLTNDTTLVVKVKGSDGTVRSATLTLA